MPETIIRDPVHDVIAFRMDRPLDALLFNLVNTPEFQRLRRIRQLGMASLAYPGADHSRYTHSLGVMETARKMLDQLRVSAPIDEEQAALCIIGALLHDLGHGPFSHVFERVTGVHHESLTQQIILDEESGVHQALARHEPTLASRVVGFLRCEPKRTFLHDIIASQLDADRFDYLLRDNLMTGSRYGSFDLEWLIHALTIDQASGRLAIDYKGVSAVEAYLQARFNMYRNVYFHKVVRSGEGMVKLALQRARRLAVQRRLAWPRAGEGTHKALLGQRLSIEEFVELDDISILHCFKVWANASNDPVLAQLCRGLLFRRVYKTIDLSRIADARMARSAVTAVERALADAGADVAYEVFYDQIADTAYETTGEGPHGEEEILVCDTNNKAVPFGQISPLSGALNQELMFRRIHVAPQWRETAEQAVKSAAS